MTRQRLTCPRPPSYYTDLRGSCPSLVTPSQGAGAGLGGAVHEHLHQKKMSTWVTAVSRARLRRQPTPMRGRADSKQTTLSTVVTDSDGSSPFKLQQDTGCQHAQELRGAAVYAPCLL